MAKLDAYTQGRAEGMAFALKIAREGGIDALEKEIKFRNIWNLHMNVSSKDIMEIKKRVALRIIDISRCIALLTLRDEFGFAHDRGLRFLKRFDLKVACVGTDPDDEQRVTLDDYIKAVDEEMNIQLKISE